MRTTTALICAGCGQHFQRLTAEVNRPARTTKMPYCSRACRIITRVEQKCAVCGTHFSTTPYQLKKGHGRCCSRACASAGRRQGDRRECRTCGIPFYVYPSYLARVGRANLYCSNACKGPAISAAMKGRVRTPEHSAAISRAKRGKPNPKRCRPLIPIDCIACGVVFHMSQRQSLRSRFNRICSPDCWMRYSEQNPEDRAKYPNGYYPYYGPKWKEIARSIRERDHFTCQDCHRVQNAPPLHVHHVKPRRLFGSNVDAANAPDNLITLCTSCHTLRENAIARGLRS